MCLLSVNEDAKQSGAKSDSNSLSMAMYIKIGFIFGPLKEVVAHFSNSYM